MARTTPTTGAPFNEELFLSSTAGLPTTTELGVFYVVHTGPTRYDAFFATASGEHVYAHEHYEVTPIDNPDAQGTPTEPWTVGGDDAGHEPHPGEHRP